MVGDGKVNSLDWATKVGMNTNYSLSFDGVDGYVEVPSSSAYKPGNRITIEGWVKADNFSANSNLMSTAFNQMRLWVNESSFNCYFNYVNAGNRRVSWDTSVSNNTWYHMACMYDGQYQRLYVDGVKVEEVSVGSDTINQDSNPLLIGRLSAEYMSGEIDEVRIWDVARSEAEIEGNMNKEVDVSSPGLVGYWKFNEGSGMVAHDATSNHIDGQLINGVGWARR